uniref:Serine protease n=1 Tax=Labrus bergylta TaxID=56723 RepID=A0A3Q3GBB6_9LABR
MCSRFTQTHRRVRNMLHDLTYREQTSKLTTKLSQKLYVYNKIRSYLSFFVSETYLHAIVFSSISYCLPIWSLTFLIATHFPCSCIKEGEVLIISKTPDQVEEEREVRPLLSKDNYVVFYIDTTGGKNTRTKTLFISNAVKKFKFLCVYGENRISVEEALNRDGHFDNIAGFSLTENDDPEKVLTALMTYREENKFKIETPGPSNRPEQTPVSGAERHVEIYQMLRQQYPDLKRLMKLRFPGDSYKREQQKVSKENFGKIQNTFSKFHIVKKLIERGESVCKVVENKCSGTGFVLFENFNITNAHLFKNCVEQNTLKQGVNVYVIFNYDTRTDTQNNTFKVEQSCIFYIEDELDYAVLQVQSDLTAQTEQGKHSTLPAGLLESIGEMPVDGAACLIGHPGGDVKQIDLTSIIETEKREQAISLEMIMKSGTKADKVMTYNTFMYHGASGSPLFDADGSVWMTHLSLSLSLSLSLCLSLQLNSDGDSSSDEDPQVMNTDSTPFQHMNTKDCKIRSQCIRVFNPHSI